MADIIRPVLLIDLSAIFRAAWHANEKGPVSVALEATLGGVKRAANGMENPLVAVCCDGKGNWRKELSPEYKAHREKQPEALYGLLDKAKKRLDADGYLLWEVEGFEADDVIATACGKARAGNHAVRVATNDKDLLQLVSPGVEWLSTATWEMRDADSVKAKFGVDPRQIGDYLALVGDASDGVQGAPTIGPKRAAELLGKYLTLTVLLGQAEKDLLDETPAIKKSITENIKQIELARKLVEIRRDVPIEFSDIYKVRELKKLTDVEDVPIEFADTEPQSTKVDFNDGAISAGEVQVIGLATQPPSAGVSTTTEALTVAQKEKAAAEYEATKQETALVRVDYRQALEPRSFREALEFGKWAVNARLYQKYAGFEAMAMVIVRGRELGYGAGASLDGFHVIKDTGQLAMHAHMIMDRAMQHPECEYFYCTETTATSATYATKNKRNPVEQTLTFTIEEAKQAGLVKPGSNWEKRPATQLRKTAGAQLARIVYPGAAMGLYSLAELGHDED